MSAKLSIDELRKHPAFLSLSDRQQHLVAAYVVNGGDKFKAVKAVFQCKDTSARTMVYAYFQKSAVMECLDVANGLSPRDVFEQQLQRAMRSPKTSPSQFAALRLYAELHGWKTPSKPSKEAVAAHRYKVGDICNVNGKHYRVTAVNADGQPTSGDLL